MLLYSLRQKIDRSKNHHGSDLSKKVHPDLTLTIAQDHGHQTEKPALETP